MKCEQNCYTCKKSTENCGINRALKYDFEPCSKWEGEQPEPKYNQPEELKTCPFCGCEVEIIKVGRDWYRLQAAICHEDDCFFSEAMGSV